MCFYARVPERPNGTVCKTVGLCLRRFESYPVHQTKMTEKELTINHTSFKLKIKQFQFGSGNARVLIFSGLHGDEDTGLLVCQDLIQKLKEQEDRLEGKVTVIPTINILGRLFNNRGEPLSSEDLNRVVNKTEPGTVADRTINLLLDLCTRQEVVIDIHTMTAHSALIAIFMNAGSLEIQEQSEKMITKFSPDLVWRLSPKKKNEIQYSKSLGPVLAEKGIVNFAIETPTAENITPKQRERIVRGIFRILQQQSATSRKAAEVERKEVKSPQPGLFIPKVGVLEEVEKDQTVGELIGANLEIIKIKSPIDGKIINHVGKVQVREGRQVLSIGKKPAE